MNLSRELQIYISCRCRIAQFPRSSRLRSALFVLLSGFTGVAPGGQEPFLHAAEQAVALLALGCRRAAIRGAATAAQEALSQAFEHGGCGRGGGGGKFLDLGRGVRWLCGGLGALVALAALVGSLAEDGLPIHCWVPGRGGGWRPLRCCCGNSRFFQGLQRVLFVLHNILRHRDIETHEVA